MTAVPCSAWCRPEEGIHVMLKRASGPLERAKACIGRSYLRTGTDGTGTDGPPCCVPLGTRYRFTLVDEAVEHDTPHDPAFPFVYLVTLQVL